MVNTGHAPVVGVFSDRSQANHALGALRSAGWSEDQLGFITPKSGEITEELTTLELRPEAVAAGVIGGGVVGGVLGAGVALLVPGIGPALAGGILAGALSGATIGAFAGGMIGAFTSLGVPEDEARYYQSELERGRTIVTVQAGHRSQEAWNVLRHYGAYNATTRLGEPESTDRPSGPTAPPESDKPILQPGAYTPAIHPDEHDDFPGQPTLPDDVPS
jgi:hypothetical protein